MHLLKDDRQAPSLVLVLDLPLRVCHWATVLIARLTPKAFDQVHGIAGYTALGLVGFRLVGRSVGSRHSWFGVLLPKLRASSC